MNRDRSDRRYAGLLGFLPTDVVKAIFAANPYRLAAESPLEQVLGSLHQRVRSLPNSAVTGELKPLPAELDRRAAALRALPQYAEFYQGEDIFEFAIAAIDTLLAPQFDVDLDYVSELQAALPHPVDLVRSFDCAFAAGSLAPPAIRGNQALFSSHRRDLICDNTPAIRNDGSGGYEIVVRARSRPNYVQVAILPDGQAILANGVHKVLALRREGVTHVPCLMRYITGIPELGLDPDSSLMILGHLLKSGFRPALVKDFLDSELSAPMLVRTMDLVLRVSIAHEFFTIPVPRD